MKGPELRLRYGSNPHQIPSRAYVHSGTMPLAVLNGEPSYVNMLDALNSWQLVRELSRVLALPAAASFKHVSPAGAAVSVPLDEESRRAALLGAEDLTPLATAYARARGADRLSSFGDWAALSERVDETTARVLCREVSDGVIAPDYEPVALRRLVAKRGGKYVVLRIERDYLPDPLEVREVFGISLEQRRNDYLLQPDALGEIRTGSPPPESARRDLTVALIALKYTQSNSICLARDGQLIGVGAGQQSRIDCVRLAADKADTWWLRRHPRVRELRFSAEATRPDRDNAIDMFLREDLSGTERELLRRAVQEIPARLTPAEGRQWLEGLTDVALASDGFFPFRDSIDRAYRSGVRYVAQPCGSRRDDEVAAACGQYGMTMICTGVRLFHH